MLPIYCDRCDEELKTPGALLFSVPDRSNSCLKMHLCRDCYSEVRAFVEDYQGNLKETEE